MNIHVVIPAYNEASNLSLVLREVKRTSAKLKHIKNIIVVDDGSSDGTNEVIRKHQVTVFRHKVNLGKGSALKTGAEAAFAAGADAIIMMDSDGQHKVADIHKFVKQLEQGFDVVLGSRNFQMGVPLVRYLGNKFASILVSVLFGIYVSDILCGFRAITKRAYKVMNWESRGYGVETEMVTLTAKKKLKHVEVPVASVYYDKFKGVTILDSFGIFLNVIRWRLNK